MLFRYASQGYLKARRITVPPALKKPCILYMCQFTLPFHYDCLLLVSPPQRLVPLHTHRCHHCYKDDFKVNPTQGSIICTGCGTVLQDRMTESDLQYEHSPVIILPRPFRDNIVKRVNHFKFWVQRIQGEETNRVTETDLQLVRDQLALMPHLEITYHRIREALRILKKRHFYNNTYYIQKRLTGEALVTFSKDHEEALLFLFRKIQTAYATVRVDRVNMLSYSFLIKKFAEILGWHEIAFQLPTLRSREKLRDQDLIWRGICHELQFPYYTSV